MWVSVGTLRWRVHPANMYKADALSGLKGFASKLLQASSPETTTWSICTLAPPLSSSFLTSVDFTKGAPLAAGAMPLKPRAVVGAPRRPPPTTTGRFWAPAVAPAPKPPAPAEDADEGEDSVLDGT
jgi:hypothetical protein